LYYYVIFNEYNNYLNDDQSPIKKYDPENDNIFSKVLESEIYYSDSDSYEYVKENKKKLTLQQNYNNYMMWK